MGESVRFALPVGMGRRLDCRLLTARGHAWQGFIARLGRGIVKKSECPFSIRVLPVSPYRPLSLRENLPSSLVFRFDNADSKSCFFLPRCRSSALVAVLTFTVRQDHQCPRMCQPATTRQAETRCSEPISQFATRAATATRQVYDACARLVRTATDMAWLSAAKPPVR